LQTTKYELVKSFDVWKVGNFKCGGGGVLGSKPKKRIRRHWTGMYVVKYAEEMWGKYAKLLKSGTVMFKGRWV
jgi:hypothetical protein